MATAVSASTPSTSSPSTTTVSSRRCGPSGTPPRCERSDQLAKAGVVAVDCGVDRRGALVAPQLGAPREELLAGDRAGWVRRMTGAAAGDVALPDELAAVA